MLIRFRVAWRLVGVAVWLLWGVLLALLFLRLDANNAYTSFQRKLVSWWSARLLSILGVHLMVRGEMQDAPILVANHISWLDIVVLMSIAPSRFLSKDEVARWPLIGWLAQRAGTVFIRRGGGETDAAAQHLSRLIELRDRVLFFPEGTSTAGEPGRFHGRLFALPISLGVAVSPIALMYHDTKIKPRSDLAYIGEQTFIQSLTHLLSQEQLVAEVCLLPSIESFSLSRNALAESAQISISNVWREMVDPMLVKSCIIADFLLEQAIDG